MENKGTLMHQNTRTIILSAVGAIFEYYDFIIYGMMSIYLSEVFFGQDPEKVAFFKTFSIFVSAYLARPFGGYIFGVIADLYGRKKALLLAMSTMVFATILIGCLPTSIVVGQDCNAGYLFIVLDKHSGIIAQHAPGKVLLLAVLDLYMQQQPLLRAVF